MASTAIQMPMTLESLSLAQTIHVSATTYQSPILRIFKGTFNLHQVKSIFHLQTFYFLLLLSLSQSGYLSRSQQSS